MKNSYNKRNLYIATPSKIDENNSNNIIQIPKDITILTFNEENNFIDIFSKEKIHIFNINSIENDKKYINVFNGDCKLLLNYIYSFNTDFIQDLDTYKKFLFHSNENYTSNELEELINFLKSEIYNLEYNKTKKISKIKRRIRKK